MNLCGRLDLSTLIRPFFSSFLRDSPMKYSGWFVACDIVLTVLFPFLIASVRVISISFSSNVALRDFSMGDSIL